MSGGRHDGRSWTRDEEAVLASCVREGDGVAEAARQLGRSFEACRRKAVQLRLVDGRTGAAWFDRKEFERLAHARLRPERLAARMGCSVRMLSKAVGAVYLRPLDEVLEGLR